MVLPEALQVFQRRNHLYRVGNSCLGYSSFPQFIALGRVLLREVICGAASPKRLMDYAGELRRWSMSSVSDRNRLNELDSIIMEIINSERLGDHFLNCLREELWPIRNKIRQKTHQGS
ncbi:MAG: hypothetical protein NXI16_10260 [Alphaproteobacteria bacterium]|nr:hypothetical protein [Alphaproteobacteria bacterium]